MANDVVDAFEAKIAEFDSFPEIQNFLQDFRQTCTNKYDDLVNKVRGFHGAEDEPFEIPTEGGFYQNSEASLQKVLELNRSRWRTSRSFVVNALHELFDGSVRHYLSLGQILVLSVMVWSGVFNTYVPDDIASFMKSLPVVAFNKQLHWSGVFIHFLQHTSKEPSPALPEFANVFNGWSRFVLEFLEKEPEAIDREFFQDLPGFGSDFQFNNWMKVMEFVASHHGPSEHTSAFRSFLCFLEGNFFELESLLFKVQLTSRVRASGIRWFDVKERQRLFGNGLNLDGLGGVSTQDDLYKLFRYPVTLEKKPHALFLDCRCHIILDNGEKYSFDVKLELFVLATLFLVNDDEDTILERLFQFVVVRKLQDLLKYNPKCTLKYKNTILVPKKWLRYRKFKNLMV